MALLPGAATPSGTQTFANRGRGKLADHHFRSGPGNLTLSSLGLGTYLGAPDAATDRQVEEAAELCLRSGRVNVFDTAINYRYQRAERSLGRAIASSVAAGHVGREMVFVATKAGYLAPDGESPIPVDAWVEETLVRPGILAPEEIVDGCHAMSPGYLADQVDRSRHNLGLETVDLLYLHNAPDTQLPVVGWEEFRERLARAFELLERLRASGSLNAYGLATWDSLRVPREHPGHLSLEATVEVAREVAGDDHGFRFIQFPFNLAMSEAATAPSQILRGASVTLFEAARQLGIGCFTSVPLMQGQLARRGPSTRALTPAQTALQFARSVPGTLGPVVGQKRPQHLSENLRLAESEPWGAHELGRFLS